MSARSVVMCWLAGCGQVQEYLQGTEYVVDSVSYDGEHRVTAFWKYDKRRANGAQFV